MRQPGIEPGAQRWQRWILTLNHWHMLTSSFLCICKIFCAKINVGIVWIRYLRGEFNWLSKISGFWLNVTSPSGDSVHTIQSDWNYWSWPPPCQRVERYFLHGVMNKLMPHWPYYRRKGSPYGLIKAVDKDRVVWFLQGFNCYDLVCWHGCLEYQ